MTYRLFYNHKTMGDVLVIVFKNEEYPDVVKRIDNVAYLYKSDELVGINIFDIKDVMKIVSDGMIAAPKDEMIDVINSVIAKGGVKLDYCVNSFYKVAKVLSKDEHPLDERASIIKLSFGDKTLTTVTRYQNINEGDNIVVAIDGCIKADGNMFAAKVIRNIPVEAEVCSEKDLRVGEKDKEAFIVNELNEGEDFYLGGK